MSKPSLTKDIIIIVLCGLVVGVLLFLLAEKHQQLASWNNFMDDYTQVAKVVHMPERYAVNDDSMQGAVIQELLSGQMDAPQDEIQAHQEDLRTNLLLLAKDFPGARQQLGKKMTADDRYDQATIDVLEAWDLSRSTGINDLTQAYSLVEQSSQGFTTAQILDPEASLVPKIAHNAGLAEDLTRMLGVQVVFARFQAMFHEMSKLNYGLDILHRLLGEVTGLLDARTPHDPFLVSCKEELQIYIPSAQDDILKSQDILSLYKDALGRRFIPCLADVPSCVLDTAGLHEIFEQVMEEVRTKLDTYSTTFYDLDELLLQGYDGPLLAFCSSLAAAEQDEVSSLADILLQLAASAEGGGSEQEGQPLPGEEEKSIREPLETERAEYLLDDIKQAQQERLQQKNDLEQEPDYSPQDLLDEMFHEFRGNDEGFER